MAQPASIPSDSATHHDLPHRRFTRSGLARAYTAVRAFTETLCEPLATEDYVVQSMEEVSPTKWHIGHTSWFFETFVLAEAMSDYRLLDPTYQYLFNSYYVAAGQRHCRPKRGLLSRPTVEEVYAYRRHVDAEVIRFVEQASDVEIARWGPILEIGIHHEQQHQELMLTDLKHNFGINPLLPAYRSDLPYPSERDNPTLEWVEFDEGVFPVGFQGEGFSYDNESPRHRVFLEAFALSSRLVSNADWLEFMADGGYGRHELWLSAGWDMVQREDWESPLYWQKGDDGWSVFTLGGLRAVQGAEPVAHVTYYEADAYARWAGARLPSEFEWEVASAGSELDGNFVEHGHFHPRPLATNAESGKLHQMFGDVWEWTQSHYSPYPGYRPAPGAIGEYNGKFMANQFVLRGGSVATPATHIRPTYRNFFHPDSAWQFSGLRLARTLGS